MFWYAVIFLSPREGKFKQKNNQLFSWLKKEGKTEASARLMAERSALYLSAICDNYKCPYFAYAFSSRAAQNSEGSVE